MKANLSSNGEALSSMELLALARAGDWAALDALCARYLPLLRRWATGRVPRWARDIADTSDLVQDALVHALSRIDAIVPDDEAALRPYLHQVVLNRVRDELRRTRRRPAMAPLDSQRPSRAASPFDLTVAARAREDYEAALASLDPAERDLIVGRIEMGMTYEELAKETGRPTANAARSAVVRALAKLADELRRGR